MSNSMTKLAAVVVTYDAELDVAQVARRRTFLTLRRSRGRKLHPSESCAKNMTLKHKNDWHNFSERIVTRIDGATVVLVVGQGNGKADSMECLIRFWTQRHPSSALQLLGTLDIDIDNLSDLQIHGIMREWFRDHCEFVKAS